MPHYHPPYIASNAAVQAIIAIIPVSSYDATSAPVDMQGVPTLIVRLRIGRSVHCTGSYRAALEAPTRKILAEGLRIVTDVGAEGWTPFQSQPRV